MNYYNEFDPYAAKWLRQLIADKLIPTGDVDDRSIVDVQPGDLAGYTQCHFFAGIGGWSYALQLAGWPADRPVWTGSCPCQPFSASGDHKGFDDDRHLWPAWQRLIRECRPATIFGEQVETAVGHGWWDLVQADLEAETYACGMGVLGAHSVGAPHIRQRLWWVADRLGQGGARLEPSANTRPTRPWGVCGEADMQSISATPFEPTDRWPQPLLRRLDDGVPTGVGARTAALRGYGNAIVPDVAAVFVRSYVEAVTS